MNLVGSKWIFYTKFNQDGYVSKLKVRLVAKGFHQISGLDYFDTHNSVVKVSTIHIIFTLVVSNRWPIHQIDVNNAFLNGELTEVVYMSQPEGFFDPYHPNHVCKLNKILYGLK